MAKVKYQFQEGISLSEFLSEYGTETQCTEALFKMKWPNGYCCKHCNNDSYCYISGDKLYRCNSCKRSTTLKSGTIFQNSNQPLTIWFQAIYFMTQSKHGISAMELKRKLGIKKHDNALAMKHKLMQAMQEREDSKELSGRIEVDDSFIGGENHGGKRGRGSENKTPFVAAVSTTNGKPNQLKLQTVESHDTKQYQKLREIKETKKNFWDSIRAAIRNILFFEWEDLLKYLLNPPEVTYDPVSGTLVANSS